MKIKLFAGSLAFAAASLALSFCSKEPVPTASNSTVATEQNTIDPYVTTDRAVCSITVVVTAGGPVTICGTNLNAQNCNTTTNPPVALTGVTVALLNVPVTFNVMSPTFLKFTGPPAPNGNSVVSIAGGANLIGINLAPNQQKNVAIAPNCAPIAL